MFRQIFEKAIAKALNSHRESWFKVEGLREEITGLKDHIMKLKDEKENLTLDKKIETRDIEHMIRVKEEKNSIELEKEKIKLEKEYQGKVLSLLNSNHAKSLELIQESKKELQAIYGEIIKRLPNVNMEIKRK